MNQIQSGSCVGENVTREILKDLIVYRTNVLYQCVETEEQYVLYTICLFTYIAELHGNVSKDSHRIITDNVTVVLKSTMQGQFAMYLFQKIYDRQKTKAILKRVAFCAVGILWFVKRF